MAGYSRGNPSMGDVLRTVVVLSAIVLGVWGVGQFFAVSPDEPTSEVDWRTAAGGIEPRAGFVPLVPDELPAGWRATRAELVEGRWQLGLVTADEEYVGLTQRPGDAADLRRLVDDRAPDSEVEGTERIGGRAWQESTTPGGDRTFARVVDSQAVVVTGSAPRAELIDFVASLVRYSP